MKNSLLKLYLLSLVLLLATSCGGGGGGGGGSSSSALPLSATVSIDGVVDFSSLKNVQQLTVDLNDNLGSGAFVKTVTVRYAIDNDDRDIYIALEWNDDTYNHTFDSVDGPLDFDGVKLDFDNNGNGVQEANEDGRSVIAASVASQYVDQHLVVESQTDEIGNGSARLSYNAATQMYQAEFLFPMTEDARNEDGVLTSLSRYNISILDNVKPKALPPTGNGGAAFGLGTNSSAWPTLAISPSGPRQHPVIPDNLTGLIAFVSKHESAVGDIYTFDPVTKVVTRVTNDPTMFKNNVSLSHDRMRIAYHATPDENNGALFEIYTVNVDGSNLKQLTNNAITDGHPAWSPDDTQIAYASFRNAGKSGIVIMDVNGNEIADLSGVNADDDNDPEYLPDGRIVFKTNRFTRNDPAWTPFELRMAVMDANGGNIVQLTAVNGVSDHDPVGDASVALFERFNKDTLFATDVESGFTAWDIIEAQLDGSGEQTLLSDGWVNWLPVFDPSGQYIAYLKSNGHTACYLMTRSGQELGRLIPGITQIEYFDWK